MSPDTDASFSSSVAHDTISAAGSISPPLTRLTPDTELPGGPDDTSPATASSLSYNARISPAVVDVIFIYEDLHTRAGASHSRLDHGQQECQRLEHHISPADFGIVSRVLFLEDPNYIGSTDHKGRGTRQTALTEVAAVLEAVKKATAERKRRSNLHSPASLHRLALWIHDKVRSQYHASSSTLVIRMESALHRQLSRTCTDLLLAAFHASLPDDKRQFATQRPPSLPIISGTPSREPSQSPDTAEVEKEEIVCTQPPQRGEPVQGPSSPQRTPIAQRKPAYVANPDGGVFYEEEGKGSSLLPGLVLEVGWSHHTAADTAKEYIISGYGHVRCVILLNLGYVKVEERAQTPSTSVQVSLSVLRFIEDDESFGAEQFVSDWDVRSKVTHGVDCLALSQNDFAHGLPSGNTPPVLVSFTQLLGLVDDAYRVQLQDDARGAIKPVPGLEGKRPRWVVRRTDPDYDLDLEEDEEYDSGEAVPKRIRR